MILGYFTEFIDLAPRKTIEGEGNWTEFATKEKVQQVQSKIQSEVSRFFGDLSTKQPQFVTPVIEEVTSGLFHSYYTIRLAMRGLDNKEKDKGRPSMFLLFEVICMVMHGAESLKVKYSNEFVDNWRGRVDYFPFDDMPTDIPRTLKLFAKDDGRNEEGTLINISTKNIERLKEYFTPRFKGMGKSEDVFSKNLVPSLERVRKSGKEHAAIALLIHESRYFKPSNGLSFRKWYNVYAEILGLGTCSYKPAQLKSIADDLKYREFYFLE